MFVRLYSLIVMAGYCGSVFGMQQGALYRVPSSLSRLISENSEIQPVAPPSFCTHVCHTAFLSEGHGFLSAYTSESATVASLQEASSQSDTHRSDTECGLVLHSLQRAARSVAISYVISLTSICAHEGGHAAMAHCLGYPVWEFHVSLNPARLLGGGSAGHVIHAPVQANKLAALLIAAAGPAAQCAYATAVAYGAQEHIYDVEIDDEIQRCCHDEKRNAFFNMLPLDGHDGQAVVLYLFSRIGLSPRVAYDLLDNLSLACKVAYYTVTGVDFADKVMQAIKNRSS